MSIATSNPLIVVARNTPILWGSSLAKKTPAPINAWTTPPISKAIGTFTDTLRLDHHRARLDSPEQQPAAGNKFGDSEGGIQPPQVHRTFEVGDDEKSEGGQHA